MARTILNPASEQPIAELGESGVEENDNVYYSIG